MGYQKSWILMKKYFMREKIGEGVTEREREQEMVWSPNGECEKEEKKGSLTS